MSDTLRKCWSFLNPRDRWRWAGLVPLVLVSAAAEALGAAAVFGLIKIIGDPTQATTLPVASRIYRWLPSHEPQTLVLSFSALVAAFYVMKNALLVLVAAAQSKVAGDSVAELSRRMLQTYLTAPLAFHFRRNSAELIRNVTESVDATFRLVVNGAVAVVSEGLIVAGIAVVLMMASPLLTVVAIAVLAALLGLLLALTRHRLARWGNAEQELKKIILQSLQQSLGGLKEVKLRGRERFFYGLFGEQQASLMRIRHLHNTLSTGARLLIETVFVCGMMLVVIVITLHGSRGPEIVPVLGLYAYAGFRVIPSINRILMNLSSIRYGTPAVTQLSDDLVLCRRHPSVELEPAYGHRIAFADRLVLDQVSFAYNGNPIPVLRNLDLTIRRGESVGIVGPTGAGKSTLIDLILGLLEPCSGRISADGIAISSALRGWQRKIGYVPQSVYLTDDTLRRNIAFGLHDEEIDDEKIQAAVAMAQLEEFVGALPDQLNTVVGERGARLSGGERQRVAIARALYHEPELLVFDEATSALDMQTERELTRAIEALHGHKTLLIIAHRLSTVRNCDRLVFLRNGSIEGIGSFDELLAHNAAFRSMAAVSAPDK